MSILPTVQMLQIHAVLLFLQMLEPPAIGNTDTVTFDYINNGGADLEVSAVTFVGPFSLSSQSTMPITTVPGTIGAFDVVFTPVVDSLYFGSMTVTNNSKVRCCST